MLKPRRVLETALYCDVLARTSEFYKKLLAVDPMLEADRVVAFDAGEGTVLLLFQRGESSQALQTAGGLVPGHHSTGPAHVAFAIDTIDLQPWIDRLQALDIAIESRVTWTRGGQSIYFRDPDGRSVELATPGTWPSY
jgi:catechol 2,3-dioxygenase-like lactoylglutathione lyase family enzyme